LKVTSSGKRLNLQVGVVMTARIAATDEHSVSTATSHVGQQHGLVVEQKVQANSNLFQGNLQIDSE
jgi:hypothetical protein